MVSGMVMVFLPVLVVFAMQQFEAIDWRSPLVIAWVVVLLIGLYLVHGPVWLDLHEDGLSIRSLLGRRFVPYTDIAATRLVQRLGNGKSRDAGLPRWTAHMALQITLADGTVEHYGAVSQEVRLVSGSSGDVGEFGVYDRPTHALANEIGARARRASSIARRQPSSLEKDLQRGARGLDEWVAAIAALGSRNHYRDNAPPEERLWRLLEDEDAARESRAAAALALRPSLHEEDRRRLLAAADACESPKLRVVLHALADTSTDDETLTPLLDRVSQVQRD